MLHLCGSSPRLCDGVSRREFLRGGQVYGSSDASAEMPVSPDDLAATVFDGLGIPLEQEIRDSQGRPLTPCSGKPVRGLF